MDRLNFLTRQQMFCDELADAVVIVIVRDSIRGAFGFLAAVGHDDAQPGGHSQIVIGVRGAAGAELVHRKAMQRHNFFQALRF